MQSTRTLDKITCLLFLLYAPSLASSQLHSDDLILLINPKLPALTATQIVTIVNKHSRSYSLDPALILSVIAVESRFKPDARGSIGERGLMQLNPKYFDINNTLEHNIEVGVSYLAYLQKLRPYKQNQWLEFYNRGPFAKIQTFPYTAKVMRYYNIFKQFN